MPEFAIGECIVQPINQIGEHVKYNASAGKFVLSRRGSVFKLSAYFEDPDVTFEDFRKLPLVAITLRCGDVYLGHDSDTGRAIGVPVSPGGAVPTDAVLVYVKQQFDSLSVSFGANIGEVRKWLRHSNSTLRFDEEGVGASFGQDASFLVLAAPSSTSRKTLPALGVEVPKSGHGRPSNESRSVPTPPTSSDEASLSTKIDRLMSRVRTSNERLASRE